MQITAENYLPGTVWFVSNFNFGHGIPTRDKYVIVLKVNRDTEEVCFALVTTRNRYGGFIHPAHGCNKFPGLTTSFFEAGNVIGANNTFSFPEPTHVYHGYNLHLSHYSDLEIYHIDERVEICDVMTSGEFDAFLRCIKESDSAKRGIKRFLFP